MCRYITRHILMTSYEFHALANSLVLFRAVPALIDADVSRIHINNKTFFAQNFTNKWILVWGFDFMSFCCSRFEPKVLLNY